MLDGPAGAHAERTSFKSDVYSFGIIAWEVLSGEVTLYTICCSGVEVGGEGTFLGKCQKKVHIYLVDFSRQKVG